MITLAMAWLLAPHDKDLFWPILAGVLLDAMLIQTVQMVIA